MDSLVYNSHVGVILIAINLTCYNKDFLFFYISRFFFFDGEKENHFFSLTLVPCSSIIKWSLSYRPKNDSVHERCKYFSCSGELQWIAAQLMVMLGMFQLVHGVRKLEICLLLVAKLAVGVIQVVQLALSVGVVHIYVT